MRYIDIKHINKRNAKRIRNQHIKDVVSKAITYIAIAIVVITLLEVAERVSTL